MLTSWFINHPIVLLVILTLVIAKIGRSVLNHEEQKDLDHMDRMYQYNNQTLTQYDSVTESKVLMERLKRVPSQRSL